MLALERSANPLDIDAFDNALDPERQPLMLPKLPAKTLFNLPMIWTSRSAHVLKKYPLLRLLWYFLI